MTSFENKNLGELVGINEQTLSENTEPDYKFKYIDLSCVNKGDINFPKDILTFKNAPSRARRKFNTNDILMSTVRPNLQGFAFIDFDTMDYICSTGFAVLSPKKNVSNKFIYYSLFSENITNQINSLLIGSNYPSINSKDIFDLVIPTPSFEEQKKIAEVLGAWDEKIELLDKQIELKEQQKKSLMQQLLSGKTRLQGFDKPWKEVKLGSILQNISTRNKIGLTRVLSVSNKFGFVLPEEYFSKSVASEDLSNYKIVSKGEFAYNPSRLNVGSIARLDNYDNGVLSPMYVIFSCRNINSDYFSYWIKTYEFNSKVRASAQGSVRNTVDFNTLSSIKINIPTDPVEQTTIADILSAADAEINALKRKRDIVARQKKGLMQQLLTGKIRLNFNKES